MPVNLDPLDFPFVKNSKILAPTLDTTDIQYIMSQLLCDLIISRRESFKKPNLQAWAKHIDLMIRIDKRDPKEIEDVIKWCQQDSFWQDNILSTAKLRKQYDALALKMGKGAFEAPPQPDWTDTGEKGIRPEDNTRLKGLVGKAVKTI